MSHFLDSENIADLSIAVFGSDADQARVEETVLGHSEPWKIAVLTATVAAVLDARGRLRLAGILCGGRYPEIASRST